MSSRPPRLPPYPDPPGRKRRLPPSIQDALLRYGTAPSDATRVSLDPMIEEAARRRLAELEALAPPTPTSPLSTLPVAPADATAFAQPRVAPTPRAREFEPDLPQGVESRLAGLPESDVDRMADTETTGGYLGRVLMGEGKRLGGAYAKPFVDAGSRFGEGFRDTQPATGDPLALPKKVGSGLLAASAPALRGAARGAAAVLPEIAERVERAGPGIKRDLGLPIEAIEKLPGMRSVNDALLRASAEVAEHFGEGLTDQLKEVLEKDPESAQSFVNKVVASRAKQLLAGAAERRGESLEEAKQAWESQFEGDIPKTDMVSDMVGSLISPLTLVGGGTRGLAGVGLRAGAAAVQDVLEPFGGFDESLGTGERAAVSAAGVPVFEAGLKGLGKFGRLAGAGLRAASRAPVSGATVGEALEQVGRTGTDLIGRAPGELARGDASVAADRAFSGLTRAATNARTAGDTNLADLLDNQAAQVILNAPESTTPLRAAAKLRRRLGPAAAVAGIGGLASTSRADEPSPTPVAQAVAEAGPGAFMILGLLRGRRSLADLSARELKTVGRTIRHHVGGVEGDLASKYASLLDQVDQEFVARQPRAGSVLAAVKMPDGTVVEAPPGGTHSDAIARAIGFEGVHDMPVDDMDAWVRFDQVADEAGDGFASDGSYWSRDEFRERFGADDSQQLGTMGAPEEVPAETAEKLAPAAAATGALALEGEGDGVRKQDGSPEAGFAASVLPFLTPAGKGRFFSRLSGAVGGGPAKTTGKKWLDLIRGQSAKGERQFTRIDDFLNARRGDSLTRDEVLAFSQSNGIKIEEVVRTETPNLTAEEDAYSRAYTANHEAFFALMRRLEEHGYEPFSFGRDPVPPPGLPASQAEEVAQLNARFLETDHALGEASKVKAGARVQRPIFPSHTEPGGENYREILLRLTNTDTPAEFRGGHWEEGNVIAHARVKDRTTPDGEKVLFIEEIQSDWAQKGREQGFADPRTTMWTTRDESGDITGRFRSEAEADDASVPGETIREEPVDNVVVGPSVPPTPFADTNAWVGLTMKRLIDEAADKGYDRIAWTTGEQQAKRYDLSQAVDRVEWKHSYSGGHVTLIATKGGKDALDEVFPVTKGATFSYGERDNVTLEDLVGKNLANRIRSEATGTAEGEDLAVGGHGMRAFYDNIVPNWVRGYAKKQGVGIEIEEVPFGAERVFREDLPSREHIMANVEGDDGIVGPDGNLKPGFEIRQAPGGGWNLLDTVSRRGDRILSGVQPSFRITPEVREMAERGAPLLSLAAMAAADDEEDLALAGIPLLFRRRAPRTGDPDFDHVLGKLDFGDGIGLNVRDPQRKLRAYTKVLDELAPIAHYVQEAKKTLLPQVEKKGKTKFLLDLDPELEAEKLARAAQGWAGYGETIMKVGVHMPGDINNPRTRSLEAVYEEVGEKQPILTAYRAAKSALELIENGKATGFEDSVGEMQAIVNRVESDPEFADILRWHEELKDYHLQWIKMLEELGNLRSLTPEEVEAGLTSVAEDVIRAGRKEYAPWFRSKARGKGSGPGTGGKRDFAKVPGGVKRQRGGDSPVIDLAENDVRSTFAFANLVMRQKVHNSMFGLLDAVGDTELLAKTRVPMERINFSSDQLKGQIDDDLFEALEPDMLSVYSKKKLGQGDLIISANAPDGKKRYAKVDPLLYESLMGLGPEQLHWAVKVFSKPAMWLRTGVTVLPDFAIANLTRDILQSAATSPLKGAAPLAGVSATMDSLRGLATVLAGKETSTLKRTAKGAAVGAVAGALSTTEFEDRPTAAAIGAGLAGGFSGAARRIARTPRLGLRGVGRGAATGTMEPDELLRLWASSGGDQSAHISMDRKHVRDAVRDMARKGKKHAVAWTPGDALRALQKVGEGFENATRLGEFGRQLDVAGATDPASAGAAAVASRDVSVDFKRHGASQIISALRPMAAFWNARVQGFDKLRRAFKENPRRIGTVMALNVTAPSLALYSINRDNPEYWDVPLWERNVYWLIPLQPFGGEGFLRVPKPFELGWLFGSLPERLVESMDPQNPFATGALGAFNDGAQSLITMFGEMVTPVPTAAMPLIENMVDYDFFLGRKLHYAHEVPEMDASERGRDRSTGGAVMLSDAGTAVRERVEKIPVLGQLAKMLEMTPVEIDNIAHDYTGGLGRMFMDSADRLMRDTEAVGPTPARSPGEMPFSGRFRSTAPKLSEGAYRLGQEGRALAGKELSIDALEERGEFEKAEGKTERYADLLDFAAEIELGNEQMKGLRDEIRMVIDDPGMSAIEKRDMLEELRRELARMSQEIYGDIQQGRREMR